MFPSFILFDLYGENNTDFRGLHNIMFIKIISEIIKYYADIKYYRFL